MAEKYRVRTGDTLSSIAVQFWGHGGPENVAKIFEANRRVKGVGPTPDELEADIEITIPDLE